LQVCFARKRAVEVSFCSPVFDDNPINLSVRILEMAWACQDNSETMLRSPCHCLGAVRLGDEPYVTVRHDESLRENAFPPRGDMA
jgi:hypothetical protein